YFATTILIFVQSKRSAEAAKGAADSATKQLTDFENIQRANIVLQFDEHEVYEYKGDLYMRGTIYAQNVGQTSALQFFFGNGSFGGEGNTPQKCPSNEETLLQPDSNGPTIPGNGKRPYNYDILLGNAEKIKSRQQYAGISLHFAYNDVFGKMTSVDNWYNYIPN